MKTKKEKVNDMAIKAPGDTRDLRHPRIMDSMRRAGAGVTARLRAHQQHTRSAHAASDMRQMAAATHDAHRLALTRSPQIDTFAPSVPTIPAIRAARPGQTVIDEADVRAYYDVELPPFWDARSPRPDLVAVQCRRMQELHTLINRSVSRPDDAVICMAVFRADGSTFAGGTSLPDSTTGRQTADGSLFAVQLFDAATGHELGRALTPSWP